MSRVLAFDFGASTGRAILAEYKNGKIEYNEVHRFDNVLTEKDGHLRWDFPYLLGEVKKAIELADNADSLAFDTWGVDYGLVNADGEICRFATVTAEQKTHRKKYLRASLKRICTKKQAIRLCRLTPSFSF